jgi:hypothetical protein
MKEITFDTVYNALKAKEYEVFETDLKPYNLNIIGIRNNNRTPNSFDDYIVVMWKYKGQWNFNKYVATTDPGLYYLNHPLSLQGTAILKEGQYFHSHCLGFHQGKYKALVQFMPLIVIRDFNKDNYLDFTTGKEETGIFGINIHRANLSGKTVNVNNWSAGCQVFANSCQFKEFISLCEKAEKYWGKTFSYTLINLSDIELEKETTFLFQ